MNNTEINKAIAKFYGWKKLRFDLDCKRVLGNRPNGKIAGYAACYIADQYVPDYCNDLNAIHELECKISNYYKWQHLHHLHEIMKTYHTAELYFATAKERAEAFVKTIGRWKESK